MELARIAKHLLYTQWQLRRAFPRACMDTIEQAIRTAEQTHCGEICFAVEGSLDGAPLFGGQSAHARALEVFSQLRVWDTEHNNGVLIYVLLADQAVEIVADRGIHARVGAQTWQAICQQMEAAFSRAEFQAGAVNGIAAVSHCLHTHFSGRGSKRNELPDKPHVLS
jgi:uncharacterized membrane protein